MPVHALSGYALRSNPTYSDLVGSSTSLAGEIYVFDLEIQRLLPDSACRLPNHSRSGYLRSGYFPRRNPRERLLVPRLLAPKNDERRFTFVPVRLPVDDDDGMRPLLSAELVRARWEA
uniref:Uncharacterized protein n=1 Tax=Candidatus Kentrum sp. LFY TaxID=2126342 RepID=A0A450U779_9GAMM|nr:MAG: hypothetical protein BECKLFY1418B_GA0070995_100723 [Candidatus Kentron sp. LFY]